jgi:ubiquinone/menaquinone biosynthesis C-methylase UbiE
MSRAGPAPAKTISSRPPRYRETDRAAYYDQHLRASRLDRRLSHWAELQSLKRALREVNGDRVLDAPCGTGRIFSALADRFTEVVSFDSSTAMLQIHRQNGGSQFCCGDIFKLPFPDMQFDWTICFRLFHHFPNRESRVALLHNLARVSREGVIFTAWVDTFLNRRRGSHRRSLPRGDIVELIKDAGLCLTDTRYAAWPFQPKAVFVCRRQHATGH